MNVVTAAKLAGGRAVMVALAMVAAAGCESKEQRMLGEWERGCAAGELDSCAAAGEAYVKGMGAAKDTAKGLAMLGDGCKRGGARACLVLGEGHATGTDLPRDEAEARKFLGKACDEGVQEGCVRSCDFYGDAIRCLHVAVLAAQGGKDLQRAGAYYRKACDHGHPLACREVGRMYREGIGVNKDGAQAAAYSSKADELFKSACAAPTKPDYCDL
jgi:TPR repeat protein